MSKNDVAEKFIEAYNLFADAIFRHCFFRTSNRELSKDIVQETFIKAWQYVRQGNKIENFKPFLYRIATNLIIDESRRKKAASLEELEEHGFEPANDEYHKIQIQLEFNEILAELEKLEESAREVIVMRYVDQLTPKEIAAILGEPENRISVRLHRALEKLRKLLNHD